MHSHQLGIELPIEGPTIQSNRTYAPRQTAINTTATHTGRPVGRTNLDRPRDLLHFDGCARIAEFLGDGGRFVQIGRASCRERV